VRYRSHRRFSLRVQLLADGGALLGRGRRRLRHLFHLRDGLRDVIDSLSLLAARDADRPEKTHQRRNRPAR
jgi:hypothetical protein